MKMSKPELYEITWINLKNIMLKKTKKEHVVFDFIYIKLKILKIMPLKMREEIVMGRKHKRASGNPINVLYLDFGDGYTREFTL